MLFFNYLNFFNLKRFNLTQLAPAFQEKAKLSSSYKTLQHFF
ncbi:hypothetical protein DB41_HF00100 [Neochlamydia sp. TUME1]|nr:hypothetical protein DB41_HF00100 [Neochlamydia sp. TUME1]